MIKDTGYARVKPIKGQIGKRGKNLLVQASFWLPDTPPPYAFGSYLQYETEAEFVRVYNPQQVRFSKNQLISAIRTMYKAVGVECWGFEIKSS